MADATVSQQAIKWVRSYSHVIIDHIANDAICAPTKELFSLFMAGSPGAGKTESSLAIVEMLAQRGDTIVRIDADEIRTLIPQYTGNNTAAIKGASFLAVEKLYDHVLKAKKSMILDSTFTPYAKIESNVRRSLRKHRPTAIIYVDQDPLVAWHFTQEREKVDGRSIPKSFFIRTLFESRENVRKIKEKYDDLITVHILRKDYLKDSQHFMEDIRYIDDVAPIQYSMHDLTMLL